ncbi:MAG: 4-hydroxyphenylpyruvate dioxygenase family protein [Leptolyngbyaceae cyanobacterium]
MNIEHLHLYVRNAAIWRDWFVEKLDFQPASAKSLGGLSEFAVYGAQVKVLISSERIGHPAVTRFLNHYAEGIADIAFRVKHLEQLITKIRATGGQIISPIQTSKGSIDSFRWCQIAGWGSLTHTLIEPTEDTEIPQTHCLNSAAIERLTSVLPMQTDNSVSRKDPSIQALVGGAGQTQRLPWLSIDHAVLNVPAGQLEPAAAWYEDQLGFVRKQEFAIATAQSGLRSLVLKHPEGNATLPINEPTSPNSQIQEFLEFHRGAGIQHVALQTSDLVQTVAALRQKGVAFLSVPATYYEQLRERPGFWQDAGDWDAIARQQILVDWPTEESQTRLLQTFTQPLFEQPTFFLELIERQTKLTDTGIKRAEGFGEGNFQALFEAIEREQQQRGSL